MEHPHPHPGALRTISDFSVVGHRAALHFPGNGPRADKLEIRPVEGCAALPEENPGHGGPDSRANAWSTESLSYNSFFETMHQKRRRGGFTQMGFSMTAPPGQVGGSSGGWAGPWESSLLLRAWEHHVLGRGSQHPFHSCVDITAELGTSYANAPLPW